MTRKAGSIVINRLRDRIRLGRYFGRWRPGDRLPSVREVAEEEAVDRKTAAAAYRRLQSEGLVRVEPRSGVYLEGGVERDTDPLRRLHLKWLERMLVSAAELGLDSATVNQLVHGVAAVERRRIPVVDPDPPHAALLARDLAAQTGLDCVGTRPERLPAPVGPLRDPPFIVATPRGKDGLRGLRDRVPIVFVTLATELLEEVCQAARHEHVLVLVGSATLKAELEQALAREPGIGCDRVEVALPRRPEELEGWTAQRRVVKWPGTPSWAAEGAGSDGTSRSAHLIDRSTVDEVRCLVARAALDHVSTSSASATRA